jgi:hypothetical protein
LPHQPSSAKTKAYTTQQEVEELPYVKRIQKHKNSIVINLGIPSCSKKIRKVRELGSELLVWGNRKKKLVGEIVKKYICTLESSVP